MKQGTMLKTLELFESELPRLLESPNWNSLDVDYEPPRVERLWRQIGDVRINLHRIHPCDQALYHPHPWPSAVKVMSGIYEMGVGYSDDQEHTSHLGGYGPSRESVGSVDLEIFPPVAATMLLTAGSSYEMIDPNGWHWVRPIGSPSLSLMVTERPWNRPSPGKNVKHKPLSEAGVQDLLQEFRYLLWKKRESD